ncbi:TPA: hypothetical protein ACX6S7_003378 [Photobacterium damselae]
MFGIDLRTANGKRMVYGHEQVYLYWGQRDITVSAHSGVQTHTLFNIPLAWEPRVYARVLHDGLGNIRAGGSKGVILAQQNQRLAVKTHIQTAFGGHLSVRLYVFVLAKHVPLPQYGIAVWNEGNELAFHNGRRALNIKDLLRRSGQAAQAPYHWSFPVACQLSLVGAVRVPVSPYQSFGYVKTLLGIGHQCSPYWYQVGGSNNPYPHTPSFGLASTAVIDVREYDGIRNLPWV